VQIIDLGCISYRDALLRQKEQVRIVAEGGSDVLFMCEHPLTITLGRKTKQENIFFPEAELIRLGYAVVKADRGGDVTLHMPGQLVVYPVIGLKRKGWDIISYLHHLEQAVVDFLESFGIVAKGDDERRGVWIGHDKVASIGIGISRWVTFHGVAVNISNDLSAFRVIRPCGLDVRMTSVEVATGITVDRPSAVRALTRSFQKVFVPV
jgi:lipoyl(octanoyl) transferase